MSLLLLGILNSQVSGPSFPTSEFELISSTTLTSTVSSITFSSIPQTFRSLQIVGSTVASSGGQRIFVTMNGNTNGNGAVARVQGSTASATGQNITTREFGLTGTSDSPGVFTGTLTGYALSQGRKGIVGLTARADPASSSAYASMQVMHNVGQINAITSLEFTPDNSATFQSGTTIQLYGVK